MALGSTLLSLGRPADGSTTLTIGGYDLYSRAVTLAASTPAPSASIHVTLERHASVTAHTPAPVSAATVRHTYQAVVSASTPPATALVIVPSGRDVALGSTLLSLGRPADGSTTLTIGGYDFYSRAVTLAASTSAPTASTTAIRLPILTGQGVTAQPSASIHVTLERHASVTAHAPAPVSAATVRHTYQAVVSASTPPATALVMASATVHKAGGINLAATTPTPTSAIVVGSGVSVRVNATTPIPTISSTVPVQPLTGLTGFATARHRDGTSTPRGLTDRIADGEGRYLSILGGYLDGPSVAARIALQVRDAPGLSVSVATFWQDSNLTSRVFYVPYRDSPRKEAQSNSFWQDGNLVEIIQRDDYGDAPRNTDIIRAVHKDAQREEIIASHHYHDGPRVLRDLVSLWQDAGYPVGCTRHGPPLPPPVPSPGGGTRLAICRPADGSTRLTIGLPPCPCMGVYFTVPTLRCYRVFNTCSLTLLDGTPIPATDMTITHDSNSWCWSLSATLIGPDAYDLIKPVAPAYLPVEVMATVNGYTWKFLVDIPTHDRNFVEWQVRVTGRSRSAWLDTPYTPGTSGSTASDYSAVALANSESDAGALWNTGWTLDWSTDLPGLDWVIPAGLLTWNNLTPIARVVQILKAVDGCLFTDPDQQILHAYPRYPSPSWTWADVIPDIAIPLASMLTISYEPTYQPIYDGVYVSGTTAGVLVNAVIDGSDGALQAPMVVDPLLCDLSGLAASARAVSVLSQSGTILKTTIATHLAPADDTTGPNLIFPGQIYLIDCVPCMSRSISIDAAWQGDALSVTQTAVFESRPS